MPIARHPFTRPPETVQFTRGPSNGRRPPSRLTYFPTRNERAAAFTGNKKPICSPDIHNPALGEPLVQRLSRLDIQTVFTAQTPQPNTGRAAGSAAFTTGYPNCFKGSAATISNDPTAGSPTVTLLRL